VQVVAEAVSARSSARFVAERTLLAWQRRAIAPMGFGLVVERVGHFLRMVGNPSLSPSSRGFSPWQLN